MNKSDLYIASMPYHVLVSCALRNANDYLLFESDKMPEGIIKELIDDSFGCNVVYACSFAYFQRKWTRCLTFRNIMRKEKTDLSKIRIKNVYLFNDVNPNSQWLISRLNYDGNVYLFEEGIGLYRDCYKRHKLLFKYFGKLFFGREYEEINRIGEYKKVTHIICRNESLLSEKQKKKTIIPFEKYEGYVNAIRKKYKINFTYRTCFIGQPLVEDGVIDEDAYLNLIRRLNEIFGGITIKPHPREKVEKYSRFSNLEIVKENDTPIEIMIPSDGEIVLLTLFSSAIVTIHCKEKFALYKLLDIKITTEIETLFHNNGVRIPGSWNEVIVCE